MKKHLLKNDRRVLKSFERQHIGTNSLSMVFSHINDNPRFESQEKEYLKQILTENINNSFRRNH